MFSNIEKFKEENKFYQPEISNIKSLEILLIQNLSEKYTDERMDVMSIVSL